MARIRTIKPEFCTSEQVTDCSPNARLLFVLMWMFCDDNGIHPRSPKRLKMECFPADDFTATDIEGMLGELEAAGLLRGYDVDGQAYVQVTGWHKHQKIDQPTPKHPLPDGTVPTKTRRKQPEQTQNDGRPSTDHSANVRRYPDEPSPPEGKGRDTGKEDTTTTEGSGTSPRVGAPADPAVVVVKAFMQARNDRWPDAMPANDARLQAEHAKILLAQPGATPELVCDLVRDAVAAWRDPVPPGGVGAFKTSIPNRIAQHLRAGSHPASSPPARAGRQAEVSAVIIDRNATIRARLRSYRKTGEWNYGGDPDPTSPYCQIPRRILAEELGEDFVARHHAEVAA